MSTQLAKDVNALGQRLVTFIHEDGTDVVSIMPEYNQQWLNQMRLHTGAAGLEFIQNPIFKSNNGHWNLDEIDVLSTIIVFAEKFKVKTPHGKETFKNEGLAAYDTIAGMIKTGKMDLGKRIFSKLFPKLSFNACYSHLI